MGSATRSLMGLGLCAAIAGLPIASCSGDDTVAPSRDAAGADATTRPDSSLGMVDVGVMDTGGRVVIPLDALAPDADAMPQPGAFCSLPGSVVSTQQGNVVMPGAGSTADIQANALAHWLGVPFGFCAHYFANVGHTRQLRFAPGGDLFLASPSTPTAGGSGGAGVGSIVVLPDDNHDGVADTTLTFLGSLPSTQGLMFANGYFYYQDGTTIRRVPFAPGDRRPAGPAQTVTTMDQTVVPQASEHWPKVLDIAQDGSIYITNGGSQGDMCTSARAPAGAIFKLGPNGSVTLVAKGLRNPIALRCESNHDVCLAAELVLDGSGGQEGREKILPVRSGDDWGFPCCATRNVPYASAPASDCSRVALESASFVVGHTPFGIDYETGAWPAPWTQRAFVTLHGFVGGWEGARVVAIALDPTTGLPLPASDMDAGASNADHMQDFATGWDTGHQNHGRPAAIAFAPDGRMFVGNDWNGDVIWMAPIGLQQR